MKKKNVSIARLLRRRSTPEERLLWRHLRNRRLGGFKFRRQEPLGGFVVDFVCHEARLVVELDGGHHATGEGRARDRLRDQALADAGFRVQHFWNHELKKDLAAVLEGLYQTCVARAGQPVLPEDKRQEQGV